MGSTPLWTISTQFTACSFYIITNTLHRNPFLPAGGGGHGGFRLHVAAPQHAFREMKLHKHHFVDLSPCYRALNIVNQCVKVSVVVINKHAQRDLVFDEKVKEQVSFDSTLLRAAMKAVCLSPWKLTESREAFCDNPALKSPPHMFSSLFVRQPSKQI